MNQLLDRLPRREKRGAGDHQDDEDARQILRSTVAVRVAAVRGATADGERQPQRNRGGRVGEVVDGVGEQRNRAAEEDDHELQQRGGAQREQRDFYDADALGRALQRVVDAVGGIVAVRTEEVRDRREESAVLVLVIVAMLVVMPVVCPLIMPVIMIMIMV